MGFASAIRLSVFNLVSQITVTMCCLINGGGKRKSSLYEEEAVRVLNDIAHYIVDGIILHVDYDGHLHF